jgi:sulfur-oxidizing protein SoxB
MAATWRQRPMVGAGMIGQWSRVSMAQQALTEDEYSGFRCRLGNVTLVHITDIHAQLKPIYFREPSINLGVGEVTGKPPHVTGADFLKLYNIQPGRPSLCADLGGLRALAKDLWPDGRHRPHRHRA